MFILNNVTYSVGSKIQKCILDSVTLEIFAGQMTAVVGLNGTGKTTLLKLMSGLFRPSRGTVKIGKHVTSSNGVRKPDARDLARLVAYVPQDFPTDFPFTVAEFVMMGRFVWKKSLFDEPEDVEIVRCTLKRLNLENLSSRLIQTLSGGERQRVLLARALVQETPAILLDEPANHLDIKNKAELYELLQCENRSHGKTIIAVTHDLNDVKKYFHSVILLKEGHCAGHGPTGDLFSSERLSDVFDMSQEWFE